MLQVPSSRQTADSRVVFSAQKPSSHSYLTVLPTVYCSPWNEPLPRLSGTPHDIAAIIKIKTWHIVTIKWRMAAKCNRILLAISAFKMYSKIPSNFPYCFQSIRIHYLDSLVTNGETMVVLK